MKSHVSDLLELAQLVYTDACAMCVVNVSDMCDLQTLEMRVKREGVSFLTITLPNFAKDFEKSLEQGYVGSTEFALWSKVRVKSDKSHRTKAGFIPKFLSGFTSRIFDKETGRLIDVKPAITDDYSSSVIGSLRQICRAFNKLELECEPTRVQSAIAGFVSTELELLEFQVEDADLDVFLRVSAILWDNCLSGIKLDSLQLSHGPGATADGISGNQKFNWLTWHERLEPYFPFLGAAYSISSYGDGEFDKVTFLKPEQELPVKVVTVPKTQVSPRIIAIEPCCVQYAQQGIRSELYARIESSKFSAGHVNFRDQSVNQMMALKSSFDRSLATIDLSEASDRVPRSLALHLFSGNPDLRDAIDSCRSTSAKLPDGEIISPLLKFASMGSALCFPVESMYFYTLCVAARIGIHNLPITAANVFNVSRSVYVYGDDLVVPANETTAIIDHLQKYNCKVNRSKTFYSGFFRESCGLDAYRGDVVTPTYFRKMRPDSRQQADRIVSWVQTANLFYKKGYWRTCSYMFEVCERYLGPLPFVSDDSPGLGRNSFQQHRSFERWNDDLMRFEVLAWVAEPVYCTSKLDGYGALQKSFMTIRGSDIFREGHDPLHLERSALHGVVTLKRRWVPA